MFIAKFSIPFALLMGFVILPLLTFFLCRWLFPKRWGKKVGLAGACAVVGLFSYGLTFGFEEFRVRQVVYESADLPEAFDGYRIVQFSDLHLGTYGERRKWIVQRVVDSIMAQKADMIVFTGDLQNILPTENPPTTLTLSAPTGFCQNHPHNGCRSRSASRSVILLIINRNCCRSANRLSENSFAEHQ